MTFQHRIALCLLDTEWAAVINSYDSFASEKVNGVSLLAFPIALASVKKVIMLTLGNKWALS